MYEFLLFLGHFLLPTKACLSAATISTREMVSKMFDCIWVARSSWIRKDCFTVMLMKLVFIKGSKCNIVLILSHYLRKFYWTLTRCIFLKLLVASIFPTDSLSKLRQILTKQARCWLCFLDFVTYHVYPWFDRSFSRRLKFFNLVG